MMLASHYNQFTSHWDFDSEVVSYDHKTFIRLAAWYKWIFSKWNKLKSDNESEREREYKDRVRE